MTVLFPKWTNRLPAILAGGAGFGLTFAIFVVSYYFSPKNTDVGYAPEQPVQYSHKLHAGLLGFDCRYCHTSVEIGPHANVPPTATCINCHQANRVKGESPRLAMVRDSAVTGKPIEWVKVHLLPDYVYFDHSAHVHAGVGCDSCHGRIDQMEVVRQAEPLNMGWCLECHRAPENHVRPTDQVTNLAYTEQFSESERLATARRLIAEKNIRPPEHCGACHR